MGPSMRRHPPSLSTGSSKRGRVAFICKSQLSGISDTTTLIAPAIDCPKNFEASGVPSHYPLPTACLHIHLRKVDPQSQSHYKGISSEDPSLDGIGVALRQGVDFCGWVMHCDTYIFKDRLLKGNRITARVVPGSLSSFE